MRVLHTCGGVGTQDIVGVLDAECHDKEQQCLSGGGDINTPNHSAGASSRGGCHLFHHVGADLESREDGLRIRQAQEHHQRRTADPLVRRFHEVREHEFRRLVLGDDGEQGDADDDDGHDLEPSAHGA